MMLDAVFLSLFQRMNNIVMVRDPDVFVFEIDECYDSQLCFCSFIHLRTFGV